MKRHYFISDDLAELSEIETRLEDRGISTPQIHVLSNDDAGAEHAKLNTVEAVLKKDVVHGTERGALVGIACGAAVLLLFWFSGIPETHTWAPAIFLAVVVLGFCTWEGGLIGIQKPHMEFRRFQAELQKGQHILMVDVTPEQETALQEVMQQKPSVYDAGEGEATPGWVIGAQNKWSRFMELAP